MMKHNFTLILKHVHDKTEELEDSLFEAGCDDALINYRGSVVYLDFTRKAKSFKEAVISAIKDTESSVIFTEVANIAPGDLVTESEIAKRLNKPRQTVSLWINKARRKSFPNPV